MMAKISGIDKAQFCEKKPFSDVDKIIGVTKFHATLIAAMLSPEK